MGKFTEASDNIKRLSKMFKGLTDFSEELEKIGSVENHISEIETAKIKAVKELEVLKADITISEVVLEESKTKANGILNVAQLKGEQLIYQANSQAYEVLVDAESKAKCCEQDIAEMRKEAKSAQAEAMTILTKLNQEIAQKEEKLLKVTEALNQIKSGI